MFRNSYNSAGSSMYTRNSPSRWGTVFIALMLALGMGSGGQTTLARAAPPSTQIRYSMLAKNLKGNAIVCVGDDVPIKVRVIRSEVPTGSSIGDNVQDISGVFVEATMSNGDIGNLHPVSMLTGRGGFAPGEVDFTFHAEKEGATTITFKGRIEHIWGGSDPVFAIPKFFNKVPQWFNLIDRRDFVEAQVNIKVEKCEYKITTISNFSAQGVNIAATMEGSLKRDSAGHLTGTATVNWIGGVTKGARDCAGTISVASSQAELNGELTDDQLILDVTYLPAALTHTFQCAASKTIQTEVTPNPVTLTLPASGGGKGQAQDLSEPTYYAMHGSVVVVVTAVKQ